ncbi:MAG: LysR family transcriptional regulator [Thermoleophilia bacterium]
MAVTLHSLVVFAAVVGRGGIADAAEETGLSQSAVSFQVAALQNHFGTPLLRRLDGRVVPTDAGADVHRYALRALAMVTDTRRRIAEPVLGSRGPFAIGAGISMGNYILPGLIADFERETQSGPFRLTLRNTEEIVAMIARHDLDLGIVSAGPLPSGLVAEPCGGAVLVLIGGAGRALGPRGELSPAELARQSFVVPPPGSSLREATDRTLASLGVVDYRIGLEVEGAEAIKRAVAAGDSVAMVVDRTVTAEVESGTLSVAYPFGRERTLSYQLVRRDTGYLPPVLVEFSSFVKERLA